jgi:hypothetical protein
MPDETEAMLGYALNPFLPPSLPNYPFKNWCRRVKGSGYPRKSFGETHPFNHRTSGAVLGSTAEASTNM